MEKGVRRFRFDKSGQVTIFVIVALVLVASVGGYFLAKNYFFQTIPLTMTPVYDYYLSCVEQVSQDGASLIGSQGGWLELPNFESGSVYSPFSSQLGFNGLAIPYWYYVSGNGIKKEQIPTKAQMQDQLARYIKKNVALKCNFQNFFGEGYTVSLDNASSVRVAISDDIISVNLNQKINVAKDEASFTSNSHKVEISSRIGKFYNLALDIYKYEQKSLFLENYSLDVMYTYAPVSGVIFNCSPAVWDAYSVLEKLKPALEANLGAIKIKGDYYTANQKSDNYFIVGKKGEFNLKNEQVTFLYSRNWPGRFEVWPTENNIMKADPVGTQSGLGAMGFCYTPYKFVYDMYFPVLVQIYNPEDAGEIFQFSLSMVIQKNMIREPSKSEFVNVSESICTKSNVDITINTYNVNLDPVEAEVQIKCFTDVCDLGKTVISKANQTASLQTKAPACGNGIVIVNAEGYKEKRYIMSTNEESVADIVLERDYKLPVEIYVDNNLVNELAVFSFSDTSNDQLITAGVATLPYNKEITIGEGEYEFNLMVYGSGSIYIPQTNSVQCSTIPQTGLLGALGLTEEKCNEITIPAQTLTNIPYAGGKIKQYISASELENGKVIKVYTTSIKKPTTMEEVSASMDDIEFKKIYLEVV